MDLLLGCQTCQAAAIKRATTVGAIFLVMFAVDFAASRVDADIVRTGPLVLQLDVPEKRLQLLHGGLRGRHPAFGVKQPGTIGSLALVLIVCLLNRLGVCESHIFCSPNLV